MKDKEIKELVELAIGPLLGGDYVRGAPGKTRFLDLSKKLARHIAKELGFPKGSFDVRMNAGGVAGSGEVMLHAENLYICFMQSAMNGMFMYRSCKGRRDCTGGHNRWMRWVDLQANFEMALHNFGDVAAERVAA